MTDPKEIWNLEETHLFRRVLVFDTVASTNDVAASLATDRANDGTAVLALAQSAGRGQHGRHWLTEPGDALLLSLVLFPPTGLDRPSIVTGWAALSVAELIRDLLTRQPILKWPNDILLDGKKLCGILVERTGGTVVGIGLNLNQTAEHFHAMGLPDAGSLRLFRGDVFSIAEVARRLLEHLDVEFRRLQDGHRDHLESRWRTMFGLVNRTCVADLHDGSQAEGRLNELGFDRVKLDDVRLSPEAVRNLRAVD